MLTESVLHLTLVLSCFKSHRTKLPALRQNIQPSCDGTGLNIIMKHDNPPIYVDIDLAENALGVHGNLLVATDGLVHR